MLAEAEGADGAGLAGKVFKGAKRRDVQQVLETLVAFGEARGHWGRVASPREARPTDSHAPVAAPDPGPFRPSSACC